MTKVDAAVKLAHRAAHSIKPLRPDTIQRIVDICLNLENLDDIDELVALIS
jgi:hypothetical protein